MVPVPFLVPITINLIKKVNSSIYVTGYVNARKDYFVINVTGYVIM